MNMNVNKNAGFTLVELLVALLIGLLLAAAIVTIYLGSQSTFRAAQGVSRSQEATRFAAHFLKTDIRQAGYSGCSEGITQVSFLNQANDNYSASFVSGIYGWNYDGTSSGDAFQLDYDTTVSAEFSDAEIAAARDANSDDAAMWASRFIAPLIDPTTQTPDTLPPVIEGLEPLRGSDIVSVTLFEPLSIGVGGTAVGEPIYVDRVSSERDLTLNAIDIDGNPIGNTGIPNGAIVNIGDCSTLETFQNSAADNANVFSRELDNSLSPGNTLTQVGGGWQKRWDDSASLFLSRTSIYYVGTGASGIPSLFRYSTNCGIIPQIGSSANCNVSVSELVEGVENMQVLYGEDTEDDGVPNRVVPADEVNDFDNVVSVEIGVLVRSVDGGLDGNNTTIYRLPGGVEVTAPDNDRFQRFVSNTTVRIHNRGL